MYYEPDPTWQSFNIHTQEEYEEKFVIKGRFHKSVHKDVVKSYLTVEYLMAHAYYHYPMYDEALKKLLGIFEMAVKLRCSELGIPLESKNKQNKRRKKILAQLIIDLISNGYPENIKSSLEWVRWQRNIWSHPERFSFGGGMFKNKIVQILNIINSIFNPPEEFIEQNKKFREHKQVMKSWLNKVFIHEHHGLKGLVYNLSPIVTLKVKEEWIFVWQIQPVLNNTKKLLEEMKSPIPIVLFIKDLELNSTGLSAYEIGRGGKMSLIETRKEQNIMTYKKHLDELNTAEEVNRISYQMGQNSDVSLRIENFIYEYCWV